MSELQEADIWWYKTSCRKRFYEWLYENGSDLNEEGKEEALTHLAEANYMYRLGNFQDIIFVFMDSCTERVKVNKLNLKLYKGRIVLHNGDTIRVLNK